MTDTARTDLKSTLLGELGLGASVVTAVLYFAFGKDWLADLSNVPWVSFQFVWLFGVMLWSAFAVVRHADCLAIKLGEPYGTLILTLSVISIEVVMITAVMITGADNPTLGRDMMFSVLMIVLNGMIGFSLLLGGYRHVEQQYNLQGANAFLALIVPLSVLGLVLPNYTESTELGTFSPLQAVFLILMSLGLYAVFLATQTMRHRKFFIAPNETANNHHDHEGLVVRSVGFHVVFLLTYMLPIVFLSKKLAVIVDHGINVVGAPAALGGFLVAALVLSPEAMAAFRSALNDQLQRSINVCMGSALATIGLTIPAVLVIGLLSGEKIILGLGPADTVLLLLTLSVSAVNFGSGRTNVLQGLIHLLLFGAYVVLIFD